MNARFCRTHGFTLAEMAVVLVIVALMLGGLLVPLSAQRDAAARRDTNRAMENIREALLGYAVVNGRLPCPAQASLATGNAGAGLASFNGSSCTCSASGGSVAAYGGANSCNSSALISGVLPWATLGLKETDGWNSRYTYAVTAAYARQANTSNPAYCDAGLSAPAPMPSTAAFALCTSGQVSVNSAASGGVPLTSANEVPAVVVSHGDNSIGAWGSNGSQSAGAAGDELENANADAVFVSNSSIDDILTWISRPILMNRMIAAGKLP